MKLTLLFVILFTVLPLKLFAQIEVIDTGIKYEEMTVHPLRGQKQIILRELIVNNEEDKGKFHRYELVYKDQRYSSIYSLKRFNIDTKESLMDLKRLIFEGFASSDNKYSVTFKMENDLIDIFKIRSLGIDAIGFIVLDKGYSAQLTKKQWEKFFEKIE